MPHSFRLMLSLGGVAVTAGLAVLWLADGRNASAPPIMEENHHPVGTSALSHGGPPATVQPPATRAPFRPGQLVVVGAPGRTIASGIRLLSEPRDTPAAPDHVARRTVLAGTVAVIKTVRTPYYEITLPNGETGWLPEALLAMANHGPDSDGDGLDE